MTVALSSDWAFPFDIEQFTNDIRSMRVQLARLASAPANPSQEVLEAFAHRATDLFGFTTFADLLVLAVVNHDEDATRLSNELLSIFLDSMEARTGAQWLFHMVYITVEKLEELEDASRLSVPLPADFSFMVVPENKKYYVEEITRMLATITLRYCGKPATASQFAYCLLSMDFERLLDLLAPMADIRIDAETARQIIDDANNKRYMKWLEEIQAGKRKQRSGGKDER